jgi:hypothetical protein
VDAELHPDLQPLAFLLGTWQGEGEGQYPTTQPFRFVEETRFWHLGDAYLLYRQSTTAHDDAAPIHTEMGFWRPQSGGRVDVSLAYPLGLSEIADGEVTGTTVHVVSRTIAVAGGASEVTRLERTIRVDGDTMEYELSMQTSEVPITRHVWGHLKRTGD